MTWMRGLRCRECGREYPKTAVYVCEYCFGPLEVTYDYDAIRKVMSRKAIAGRDLNLWRYRELLPIDNDPTDGWHSGFTPLVRANRLGRALGVKEIYLKDDSVSHPTYSFKDRVVAVALSRAKELGFDTVSCASTGNLANSVAAQSATAGLESYIFIPADLETGKVIGSLVYAPHLVAVEGNYDEVNRLCSEIGAKYRWAFVNINIRPYYAEGSKTFAFEIAEQLGWKSPQHVIVPSAGGSLITKIWKGLHEFELLGLIEKVDTKVYCAQAEGCGPIVTAIKEDSDIIRPVKPNTIAKSLAIGNPADGHYAVNTVKASGGTGEHATDGEIVDAIKFLAETEGVFTETAGGVTMAVTKKLIESGRIPKNESIVVCITGNGMKTREALDGHLAVPVKIRPTLSSFEASMSVKRPS